VIKLCEFHQGKIAGIMFIVIGAIGTIAMILVNFIPEHSGLTSKSLFFDLALPLIVLIWGIIQLILSIIDDLKGKKEEESLLNGTYHYEKKMHNCNDINQ
jgi:hypothetical protein